MEAHSVLAAPHNCRDVEFMRGHWNIRAKSRERPLLLHCNPRTSSPLGTQEICLYVEGNFSLWLHLVFTSCPLRCTQRQKTQLRVCALQLVLWIRPITDTSYNPAISQHQGGTTPLSTTGGAAAWWCWRTRCKQFDLITCASELS